MKPMLLLVKFGHALLSVHHVDADSSVKVEAIEEDGESSQEELEQLAMASC